jgi:hypothetical protein
MPRERTGSYIPTLPRRVRGNDLKILAACKTAMTRSGWQEDGVGFVQRDLSTA